MLPTDQQFSQVPFPIKLPVGDRQPRTTFAGSAHAQADRLHPNIRMADIAGDTAGYVTIMPPCLTWEEVSYE